MKSLHFLMLTAIIVGNSAHAQSPSSSVDTTRAEVLVLGVYHMANPGLDVFNMEADDPRSSQRQREIAELQAVLKKFKPTKIAVEHNSQTSLNQRYKKYLSGQYSLTADETDQMGLRMAMDLGHDSIYAADADGDFPMQHLINYAKATGQSAPLDSLMSEIEDMVERQSEYLAAHTILEMLVNMNSDESVARDMGYYVLGARFGEPGDYAGPNLLTEWYRRNLRIYNNVTKLLTEPEDRILVIFGAGHLGWLRQAFALDPLVRLRKLDEFVTDTMKSSE